MVKKNTGTDYELISMKIFEAILNRKDVHTIEVRHDVRIKGKTTTHQIDVFWKFNQGDITYTTIVQAKDWEQLVNQGELLKFQKVLEDIPHQPRGVFVTRTGYDEGALRVASAHGIQTYVLRSKKKRDSAREVVGEMVFTLSDRKETGFKIIVDETWLKAELVKRGLPRPVFQQITFFPKDLNLFDLDGNVVGNLQEIIDAKYPSKALNVKERKVVHKFQQSTFLKTGPEELPTLKILAIHFTISAKKEVWRTPAISSEIVEFILENVAEGTVQRFDYTFKPLS